MSRAGDRAPAGPGLVASSRFEILRCLGKGGMGVVYAARDRVRRADVALKTLRELDPTALYRFKREFRALADVAHPNLATLYELLSDEDRWFFTMELVDGVDFISYVRGGDEAGLADSLVPPRSSDAALQAPHSSQAMAGDVVVSSARIPFGDLRTLPEATSMMAPAAGSHGTVAPPAPQAVPPPLDLDRLRATLRQLAEGLHALHRNGFLHRDIKPSNVLVTHSGRVVVLDFGLIADFADRRDDHAKRSGTPAYMAPEQGVDGADATPACDWYGVGVVLYEALTGRRPFEGSPPLVLRAKQQKTPVPPKVRVPGVPNDLNELCVALLRVRPGDRPSGEEVLRRLSARGANATDAATPVVDAAIDSALVGRDAHLRALGDAYGAAVGGKGLSLFVSGESGVGKSELVHRFLAHIERDETAVVLKGRCYERESVPFKGIDSLVDALATFLLGLPRRDADELLPADLPALARVLPVLARVPAIAEASRGAAGEVDPHELRRRAFAALRALLATLARKRPTVLFVDDLHWGDADSGTALAELMQPPDPPPLLLVGTYRSEEASASPLLRAFRRRDDRLGPASTLREVAVRPLDADDSRALAALLLQQSRLDESQAGAIAEESGGSPYFIHALVQFLAAEATAGADSRALTELRLDDVVAARIDRLPADARRLLEIVCVAGRPIERGTTRQVAQQDIPATAAGDAWPSTSAMEILRTHHLVRMRGTAERVLVEPYHDRIREAVVAALAPNVRCARHRHIAQVLETHEPRELEALAYHYTEAGADRAAAHYALLTGDVAFSSCAFANAAEWYETAARLQDALRKPSVATLCKLGDALANAGRGRAAADAYRRASQRAEGNDAVWLRSRAAGELLRSGHLDDGVEELRPGLAAVGIRLARHPLRGLLSLSWRRLQIALRGLRYRERALGDIAPTELTKVDLCWAGACGFSMTDMIWGAELQTRHLALALRTGDPFRVGRAITLEVAYHAVAGPRAERRVDRLLAELERCAERTGDPALRGMLQGTAGLASYQFGRWLRARELGERAVRTFREQCVGVRWEATSAQIYLLWALCYLGDLPALRRYAKRFRDEAAQCGDRYAEASMSIGLPALLELADDRPDTARAKIAEVISSWSARDFHLQHYFGMVGLAHCELYEGDGAAAYERVHQHWRQLRRAYHMHVHIVRHEAWNLRARAALAATASASRAEAPKLVAEALRDAKRMTRERAPWALPLARLIRAGADFARAPERAAAELEQAERELDAEHMQLHATLARRRRGELLGGEDGAGLRANADEWCASQGIRDPDALARTLIPVFHG